MQPFTFREEEAPRFKLRSGGLFALLLLLLLLLATQRATVFNLSPEQLARIEREKQEQERQMVFRFMDAPEDKVEERETKFFSDADRIKRSQKTEENPENDDPISQGNTFELEQAQPSPQQDPQPAVVLPPVPETQPTPKPTEPPREEPRETDEREQAVKDPEEPVEKAEEASDVPPLVEGGPKPYRKPTERDIQIAENQAKRDMRVVKTERIPPASSGSRFHNPGGSSAPQTGITVETTRHDLGAYLNILRQLVKGNWRIPSIARFEVSGFATVYFNIQKDGKITDARLVTSSTYEPLDTSALNAIINTYQLPPLPDHVDETPVPITFGFYYNMRPRY